MNGELAKVPCNVCGSSEYEDKYYRIRSGELVRCRKCDMYYASPRRTEFIREIIDDLTPETLYDAKTFNYKGRIAEFDGYLEKINGLKRPPGRMLDVGCYEGFFLAEARKYGWETYGVEPNKGGAKYARSELGLDVRQCTLENAGFEDGYFDVVTLISSIEHVPDPSAVLLEVRRIMRSDGLLMVSVPKVPFYLGLVKSRWRMFIGDHYFFFTDRSMGALLGKFNFTIVKSHYVAKSVDLDTISARLADEWQPNNLGSVGRLFRRIVKSTKMGNIRLPINLFDSKVYFAVRK